MKRYSVLVTHDITESRTIIVEAEDLEEAMEKAHDMAFFDPLCPDGQTAPLEGSTPWERNDCGDCQGAYCAGGEEDVQEVAP